MPELPDIEAYAEALRVRVLGLELLKVRLGNPFLLRILDLPLDSADSENESNYSPRCQTAGRILADRALSRLLKDAWPQTIEELEVRLPASTPQPPTSR